MPPSNFPLSDEGTFDIVRLLRFGNQDELVISDGYLEESTSSCGSVSQISIVRFKGASVTTQAVGVADHLDCTPEQSVEHWTWDMYGRLLPSGDVVGVVSRERSSSSPSHVKTICDAISEEGRCVTRYEDVRSGYSKVPVYTHDPPCYGNRGLLPEWDGGKPARECPYANLIGCCGVGKIWIGAVNLPQIDEMKVCYYAPNVSRTGALADCARLGGSWSPTM